MKSLMPHRMPLKNQKYHFQLRVLLAFNNSDITIMFKYGNYVKQLKNVINRFDDAFIN